MSRHWFKVGDIWQFRIVRCNPYPAFLFDPLKGCVEEKREFVYKTCLWLEINGASMIQAKNVLWHLTHESESLRHDNYCLAINNTVIPD